MNILKHYLTIKGPIHDVRLRVDHANDMLVVSIEDDAPVSIEERKRCLLPFQDVALLEGDKQVARDIELSIAQELIYQQGGKIEFKPNPRHGADVVISFPTAMELDLRPSSR